MPRRRVEPGHSLPPEHVYIMRWITQSLLALAILTLVSAGGCASLKTPNQNSESRLYLSEFMQRLSSKGITAREEGPISEATITSTFGERLLLQQFADGRNDRMSLLIATAARCRRCIPSGPSGGLGGHIPRCAHPFTLPHATPERYLTAVNLARQDGGTAGSVLFKDCPWPLSARRIICWTRHGVD